MIVNELKNLSDFMVMEPIYFPDMIKGVCDIKKEIIALHAEMHVDLEQELLNFGSDQENLIGFNIYYDGDIELDSNINPPVNRRLGYPRSGRLIIDPETVSNVTKIIKMWVNFDV